MKAQMNQGIIPASLIRPDSRMAKFLPITAMLPLSKYRKGRGGLPPPSSLAIHLPTYRPCWIWTYAPPWQRSTVLYQGRGIADDEYLARIGDVQKWADACPAGAVGSYPEHLDDR